MSSPPSLPLPFLPTEVKKEILKFCDQPTLAKTSSLSLAFLQLSSPLLYRHIEFEGPEGLTKFLTLIAKQRHPELEPWLDLSLVYSVIYIDVEEDPFPIIGDDEDSYDALRLVTSSSPSPRRLPLQSLQFNLREGAHNRVPLYNFFNPVVLRLEGCTTTPGKELMGKGEVSLLQDFSLYGWDRLRELVFVDAFFTQSVLEHISECESSEGGYGLVYDISVADGEDDQALDWIAMDVKTNDYWVAAGQVSSVMVSVCSEKQKTRLLALATGSGLLPRITVLVKSSTETASTTTTSA